MVVRTALAQVIAQIAETSTKYERNIQRCVILKKFCKFCFPFRFLDCSQTRIAEKNEIPRHSFDSELATLHEMLQQCVSSLLTDSQNIVKRTLIENGINKLCIFFGRQKCQ